MLSTVSLQGNIQGRRVMMDGMMPGGDLLRYANRMRTDSLYYINKGRRQGSPAFSLLQGASRPQYPGFRAMSGSVKTA
jgi:hypothetical protein